MNDPGKAAREAFERMRQLREQAAKAQERNQQIRKGMKQMSDSLRRAEEQRRQNNRNRS